VVAEDDLRVRVPVPVARLLSRLLATAVLHALRAATEQTSQGLRSTAATLAPLLSPLQLEPAVSLEGQLVRSLFTASFHATTQLRRWTSQRAQMCCDALAARSGSVSTASLTKRLGASSERSRSRRNA
jgi:hypothetical protein